MKIFVEHVQYYLGLHGEGLGLFLVLAPVLRDLIWSGAREFNLVSIGNKGVIVMLLGVALIVISKHIKKVY